MVTYTI